jgi:hypothetical protein
MSDAKRTQRVRDAAETLTLEEHIASHRAALVAARENAPVLRAEADALCRRATGMTTRWQWRMRRDAERRADELRCEADVCESMRREHAFESLVVTYLRRYYHQGAVAAPSVVVSSQTALVDEFLTEMHQAPPKVSMCTRDTCPRCEGQALLVCSKRSVMSCNACGYTVTYLDATSAATAFDETVEFSQYSYKRVNHYSMWLTLVQGKEVRRVPDDVLEQVMHDLYHRCHVQSVAAITHTKVRDSLRHLRLRRAYEHVTQITSRLTGQRPPRIAPHVEEQLRNMFLQMQPAFQRHAPKSRTNFLSYSYVLYRCFQILGLDNMLPGITLLKGRDKLEANDAVFRRMCTDLGWPIFDLPDVNAVPQ